MSFLQNKKTFHHQEKKTKIHLHVHVGVTFRTEILGEILFISQFTISNIIKKTSNQQK